MPFNNDHIYKKADRSEMRAHGQTFVLYEFSYAFVAHRLLLDQFEDWFEAKGRFLAGLDDTPENRRRLRDLAWHQWFRGRPAQDTSRPSLRLRKNRVETPLQYGDLLTADLLPLFENSTFWMAERLAWDRDLGHLWKLLINPLHLARTRTDIERLLLDDVPSPWRWAFQSQLSPSSEWVPDRPSQQWN